MRRAAKPSAQARANRRASPSAAPHIEPLAMIEFSLSNSLSRALGALALSTALLLALAGCVTPMPRALVDTPTPVVVVVTATPAAVPTPSPSAPAAASDSNGAIGLASGGLLDVRGPLNGAAVQTDEVVVHGFAAADAQVEVNGQEVDIDDEGRFRQAVALSPGVNGIEVAAAAPDGQRANLTLTVISLALPPQPFFLLITQPENQSVAAQPSIPLAGRTTPGTVVSVNGISLSVDAAGVFSTTVTLEPGPNIIDVAATGAAGETLNETIAVIYRP